MAENNVAKYNKYTNYVQKLITFSGLWPKFEKQSLALRLFLMIQAATTSCLAFCGVVYSFYLIPKNVSNFTNFVRAFVGYFTTIVKFCTLAWNQRDLNQLNIEISMRFHTNLKIPENQQYLLAHFPTFSRFFYIYTITIGASLILLITLPLLLTRRGIYAQISPIAVPFSYEPGGLIYWLIIVFEISCLWNMWTLSLGTDNLFCCYCLQIVGELRLLSNRFRNLTSSKNYHKDVRNCIQSHMLLKKSFLKVQKIFGFLALWFAVSCAVCLCSLIFMAVEMKPITVGKVLYFCNHSFVKLFQAYLYTWSGNIITVESETCLAAAYEAHWSSCYEKRFMKDVLTVLIQRPMVFKASKMIELRMELFMKIVNSAVSYFFLLRTLDANS